MKTLNWQHRAMMILALMSVPMLTGAQANGCGGSESNGGGDGDCVVGGCSGQLCVDSPDNGISTCEWRDEYACYQQHGICERNASNKCGWRQTQELQDCVTAANNPQTTRMPASGQCIRNSQETCSTDADCKPGGCGGELCEAIGSSGATDCNCTAPQGVTCGCVNGTCSWWQ